MLWFRQNKEILSVILLSLPIILPLINSGFFSSDDGEWMIIRFSAFHQALVDGQFPVRFLGRLNHEYGYPVANFLYPGFMYLAEVPKTLGFGFVDSIKIIIGLSIVSSGVFTYLWLNKVFDRLPALTGAFFYLYASYHLYDLYKRGSVGEILSLAVAPFVFWQIERKSIFWTSAGIALLITSHNTLALLFLPVIAVYMYRKQIFSIRDQALSIILGFLISSFFWVPAIFDLQHTVFFQTQVSNWQDHWANINLVGPSTLLIFILSLILYRGLFLLVGILSVFLSLPISSFIWQFLPVTFVQFPFRFLSLTILCASFLAASTISVVPKKMQTILGIVLVILTLISARQFMQPAEYFDRGEGFYTTNQDSTTVRNEYMPKWVLSLPVSRAEKLVEFAIGNGSIENISSNNKEISFVVKTQEDANVRVNKIFFPGWFGFVDGQEHVLHYNNAQGVIDIGVPAGESNVRLVFQETRMRTLADFATVVGIVSLGVLVKKRRNK